MPHTKEQKRARYRAHPLTPAEKAAQRAKHLKRMGAMTAEQIAEFNTVMAAHARRWRKANPDREKAKRAKYRASLSIAEKREQARRAWLKKGYGLTVAQYEAMFKSQNGACKICSGQNLNGRPLGVDHDHKTGKIRGLLCQPCNLAIGYMNDDILTLYKAADYLEAANRLKEVLS